MTDKEIIAVLEAFTHPEKDRTISQLAFNGTSVYATDGRLAIDGRLSSEQHEKIPENYPIQSLREILDGSRAVQVWYTFKFSEFEQLDGQFMKACKDEWHEIVRNHRERYVSETCPCCYGKVYWDMWNDELVKEKEEMSEFDCRDVFRSTQIRFASGESILVNFCYLHLLVKVFGRDLRLAIGHCTDKKNPMLYLKTVDDRFYGVLLPLRAPDGMDEADYTLYAEEELQEMGNMLYRQVSVVPAGGEEHVRTPA